MKRVFIGIPLSIELRDRVLEWKSQVKDLRLKIQDDFRWIADKNLHVTLVPPWERNQWTLVSEQLKVVRFEPFEIKFDRISLGPNAREPRMVWATGYVPDELKDLKLKIERLLGVEPEQRLFRLHATLARFKPADQSKLRDLLLPYNINWRQTVTSFCLYESHLSSQGADYQILATFP